MQGQFLAGAVKRLLGWAPFSALSLPFQGRPCQSTACSGGFLSSPSHHTVLSSRLCTTLVKMVSRRVVARALGLDLALVPGATPKKPYSGFTAHSRPSGPTRSQAMSSPTHQTFQPAFLYPSGGMSMARLVLPQAEGKAADR